MKSLTVFGAVLLFTLLLAAGSSHAQTSNQAPPQTQPETSDDEIMVPPYKSWTLDVASLNLKSSDKAIRLAALRRLASEKSTQVHTWIAEAARFDPEARIRNEAVQILAYRNESVSLPILMHIADTDKDQRVRDTAKAAINRVNPTQTIPTAPAAPVAPGQPQPQPIAPPPVPTKNYDADGNELPPNYLDTDMPAPTTAATQQSGWNISTDNEKIVDDQKEGPTHTGFLLSLGYDGAMGMPRDTHLTTSAAMQIGFEQGSYSNTYIGNEEVKGHNDFMQRDFSVLLMGRWSPFKYFEFGLDLEVFTAEKLEHNQTWKDATPLEEGEESNLTENEINNVTNDASYSGGALGFTSLSAKSIFIKKDKLRAGIAFRLTIPTHTGKKFDKGIGASDLFLPTFAKETTVEKNETINGKMWGMEPGLLVSYIPIENLTVYSDITFMMTFLNYDLSLVKKDEDNIVSATTTERTATALFLVANIGAQYRLLDDILGLQLAISPTAYLGKNNSAGGASMGVSPGIYYRLLDMIDINLVANIEVGSNSDKPFTCTGLQSTIDQEASTACGVGRRFGIALSGSYSF